MNFCSHIADISLKINKNIHCVKTLFYLSTNLKLQFFKTLLLPYFDYCLSLAIYFSKTALQKLCNLYYNCLYKFFKFNLNNVEGNWANDFLKRFGLFSFQHCLFYRLSMFVFKCRRLVDSLETNDNNPHTLRNRNNFKPVQFDLKEGKKTFKYFFSKFLNNFYVKYLDLNFFCTFINFVLKYMNIFHGT